jgi:hypothetical protein
MTAKMTALDAYSGGKIALPPGYRLGRGADVMLLRGYDGSVVAAFCTGITAPSEVARTAEQDYRASERTTMPQC